MQYGSPARPQRFGSEINNSNPPLSGRSRTEPTCTEPAHSGRFVGAQHDQKLSRSRSQRHSARPMALTSNSQTPTFANAASSAALRNGTAAVIGTKQTGASAPQNNRSSASHQFSPATISVYHITSLTTTLAIFSTAPFLSKPSDPLPHPCGMAAPRGRALMVGRHRRTSTRMRNSMLTGLSRGFGLKCTEKKRSGRGVSQKGGDVQHADQVCRIRGRAFSSTEGLRVTTKRFQIGNQCNPLHCCPSGGPS